MPAAKIWNGTIWAGIPTQVWVNDDPEEDIGFWGTINPKKWDGEFWVTDENDGAGSVVGVFSGRPETDAFQVSVDTVGVEELKLVVTDMDDELVTVVGPVSVPSYNVTKISVTGLSPNTEYKYQTQVQGGDGEWADNGTQGRCKTSIPLGTTNYSFKVAMHGCQAGHSPRTTAFDDMVAWGPDWHINGGDWHYVNETGMSVAAHRPHWFKAVRQPGYALIYPKYGLLHYSRSDHDGGGSQAAGTQHESTPYNMQAYHEIIPHFDMPEFIIQEEALCTSFGVGDILFIATDIRTLARSPFNDPETAAKTALGDEQTEWVIEQIGREDYRIKILITDCPWPGVDYSEVEPKKDHWANYTYNRQLIADAMEEADGFIVQFDYHGMGGCEAAVPGGWPLLGCSGTDRDGAGNLRDPQNYDYVFGEAGVSVRNWGKLEVVRVDDEITVTLTARDAKGGADAFEIERTFDI